jgi:hypothetical protein
MNNLRITSLTYVLAAICALPLGCSAGAEGTESGDTISQAISPGQCNQAVAKDVLVAQLVQDSAVAGYPLTRLSTDANGLIGGPNLPDAVAGDLEIINTVVEARDSVARALVNVSGLADYDVLGIGPDTDACTGIPAWTPNGSTTIDTKSNEVFVGATNHDSWVKVQKEFSKECPLVKRLANKDIIDPPGDGSTSDPTSETVSSTGVTANAFGLCPAGTPMWTYCKQYNATGVNFTGRACQPYYNSLRCLLY